MYDQFEVIHFTHRLLALSLVSFLIISLYRLKTYFQKLPLRSKVASFIIPFIILTQIILGAFLIILEVPGLPEKLFFTQNEALVWSLQRGP